MTIADWLMILAVLSGPILAVAATRWLDVQREIRDRKLRIFKTLMATRASTLAPTHVEALNMIDLEFHGKGRKNKAVISAWKNYLDHLNTNTMEPQQWGHKRVDLLVELLRTMAVVLEYDFDASHIRNSSYMPRGYGEIEEDQIVIRKGITELLSGKRPLPMYITNVPQKDG